MTARSEGRGWVGYVVILVLLGLFIAIVRAAALSDEDQSVGRAISIDTDVAGNAATTLGPREDCVSIDAGESVEIDITTAGLANSHPIAAYEYELVYPSGGLVVTAQNPNFILVTNPFSSLSSRGETLPDANGGDWRSEVRDIGGSVPEIGSGVLERLTLKASESVPEGVYALTLNASGFTDARNKKRVPAAINGAVVAVGRACDDDAGYRDFTFSPASAPTAEKPQSKLWFNDGVWWAVMFQSNGERFNIFRLDATTQTWLDTGALVDTQNAAEVDVLSDGRRLYIAAAVAQVTRSIDGPRLLRYSYDAEGGRYALDPGYPVTIASGGVEAIVLAKDSADKLWVTYTRDNSVHVSHTTTDDRTWLTPYVLPLPQAADIDADDISTIVAFESRIGVMWSDQEAQATYFATHSDGSPESDWDVSTVLNSPKSADDHLNLKALDDDPAGEVFVVLKTSTTRPDAELIRLLALQEDGKWASHTVGLVSDNHTRPIVVIDTSNRILHVFMSSPCCTGGTIYHKQTSLDRISFEPGLGEPFLADAVDKCINNPTSTKQSVTSGTDLVVLAGTVCTGRYLHNTLNVP